MNIGNITPDDRRRILFVGSCGYVGHLIAKGLHTSDLMDAIVRAVYLDDHTGFEVINITGDMTGERVDLSKAERILGWRPTI